MLVARMKDTGSWAAVSKGVVQRPDSTAELATVAEVATTVVEARMVEADPTAAGATADIVNALAR
jgi:hypothetical protein